MTPHTLTRLYSRSHDMMRDIDGLQPQEAFDELLKYLLFKQVNEVCGPRISAATRTGESQARTPTLIRNLFKKYVGMSQASGARYWTDRAFRLSDRALTSLHDLCHGIEFSSLAFDIRSAALAEFLSPDIRRGLGVYLTPDPVVEMTVAIATPKPDQVVYDPACGSGTFLVETLKRWRALSSSRARWQIYGSDKNPRMLQIAELNLSHQRQSTFRGFQHDALALLANVGADVLGDRAIDVILTNPPFGVTIDTKDLPERFRVVEALGTKSDRMPSEILFIERCLKLLRPGGRLAIVLPKSVVTNSRFEAARRALGRLGYVEAAVYLPSETFLSAGAMTTTVVLFFRTYDRNSLPTDPHCVLKADVSNVGYDSTGRPREGRDTLEVASAVLEALRTRRSVPRAEFLVEAPKEQSLDQLARLIRGPAVVSTSRRLRDVAVNVSTGKTPPRSLYTNTGLFTLKVGNLTGHGIDWRPRDRNYVPDACLEKKTYSRLLLEPGDIVLTSSAHAPRYIAKKVDIVTRVPSQVGGRAVFVGEVLRIRPAKDLSPWMLLMFLRLDSTVQAIQQMIRGQTAHLMPDDLAELEVPDWISLPTRRSDTAIQLLKRQSQLAEELNRVQFDLSVEFQAMASEACPEGSEGTP